MALRRLLAAVAALATLVGCVQALEPPDDTWEVWGTKYPTGSADTDKALVEGRLRNAMMLADFERFKEVLLSQPSTDVNSADSDGRTGLHLAAIQGHGGDSTRVKVPWTQTPSGPVPWRDDMGYEMTFLQNATTWMQSNGFPPFDVWARDRSGQTPLHEACLHGNILTVRWLENQGAFESEVDSETDGTTGFLRAEPLYREWYFGWTMMNWAAINSRNDVRRKRMLNNLQLATENPNIKTAFTGMTVLDYAVINGHADVVEYIVSTRGPGITGLVRAKSNWREEPIHKAATLGHLDVFKVIMGQVGCSGLSIVSEGGESPLINAAGGGHYDILQYAQQLCPPQFEVARVTPTSLTTDPTNTRHVWGEETPCQISSSIVTYIKTSIEGKICNRDGTCDSCPDGKCDGNFRSFCTHDESIFCYRNSDCTKHDPTSACDTTSRAQLGALDLLSHWQTCELVCAQEASSKCSDRPGSTPIV
eukprot:CAMPEP_0181331454 /NCGR_PEP_ID=MMETSP1101-20121128/24508_1 /TAXON_ID=46948 /ORGANISM="Rhodomonas abbreviata, Strain Caron Lab Isolate" /LENGTH=476 /DNA_ID=CAMNT_0023440911 /DNA_START=170 /DNA_END=1600 /DNA_ORIENTATION=+